MRFIVTNLNGRGKHLYKKVYCARGKMENLIKAHKLYTKSDPTSCHRWEANQFRLFLHTRASRYRPAVCEKPHQRSDT